MSFLVLQSFCWGRDSLLLYFCCVLNVMSLLLFFGSSLRCHGLVCSCYGGKLEHGRNIGRFVYARIRKVLAMHLYALVLLVYGTSSKHKGGLSEIELSATIFGNSISLENLRISIFITLTHSCRHRAI